MNYDKALQKFKYGKQYLNYCLTYLKPLIIRTLKLNDDFYYIHKDCCIDYKTQRFEKSTDGVYDFFDDLILIEQYIACALMLYLCSKSTILYFESVKDESILIKESFNDELILIGTFSYMNFGNLISEERVEYFNDLCKKNKVKKYREWEK